MAGLPLPVVERAKEVLSHLEAQRFEVGEGAKIPDGETSANLPRMVRPQPKRIASAPQMSLFMEADPVAGELRDVLKDLDLNRMAPIEALMKLLDLQKKART